METIDRPALTPELDRAITRVLLAAGDVIDRQFEAFGRMTDSEFELEKAMAELDNAHWLAKHGEQK